MKSPSRWCLAAVAAVLGNTLVAATWYVGAAGDTPIRGLFCAANVTVEGVTFSNCWAETDSPGYVLAGSQSAGGLINFFR